MARVTVEDCLQYVDNRFELVLLGSKRARQLASGRDSLVEWENDKPTVVALREIAEGKITPVMLEEESERSEAASTISDEEIRAETTQVIEEDNGG